MRVPPHESAPPCVMLEWPPTFLCLYISELCMCDFIQSMVVESASRLSIRRPHSLFLMDSSSEFFVAFGSKEEKDQWMEIMNQVYISHITVELNKLVSLLWWKRGCMDKGMPFTKRLPIMHPYLTACHWHQTINWCK